MFSHLGDIWSCQKKYIVFFFDIKIWTKDGLKKQKQTLVFTNFQLFIQLFCVQNIGINFRGFSILSLYKKIENHQTNHSKNCVTKV